MADFSYTGADLIADFIAEHTCGKAFIVTGGACAFIVDAIGRNPKTSFVCFQHEQAAAMAADAVWRTTGKVGVTVATSGPGATNLVTGIACSWFDSIPSLHITGQVNQSESRETLGANVRQSGFQETDIVSMVRPITKLAVKVESIENLVEVLPKALAIAKSGRMGPVLLDVPMNIQTLELSLEQREKFSALIERAQTLSDVKDLDLTHGPDLSDLLKGSKRPVVLVGAGAGLAGTARQIQSWCERHHIPYVTSWGAISYIDRNLPGYFGSVGVYGSRRANWLVQSADDLIVFGSRLDNRQRTGNPKAFAPFARITVIDVDVEELRKFSLFENYKTCEFDLKHIDSYLISLHKNYSEWMTAVKRSVDQISEGFEHSVKENEFNPYHAVRVAQSKFTENSIVVSDCGANLCWVYQSFLPDSSFLFTAAGNSPMGYSLPAAIGAQIARPNSKVYCFIGDGGLQMNIQELQTIVAYDLPIIIFIQNNFGYGIIRQFQESYLNSRYYASGEGYTVPDFQKIASAYGIPYMAISSQEELQKLEIPKGNAIIDLHFSSDALITPKTEINHFIHDQFPYVKDNAISTLPYAYPSTPQEIAVNGRR